MQSLQTDKYSGKPFYLTISQYSDTLLSVVSIQIHLLNLFHQWIPGICTGALVVEGLLYHVIQPVQKIRFVNAVIPDSFLNAAVFFQLVDFLNQAFQLFFVGIARDAQVIRNLGVPVPERKKKRFSERCAPG